MPPKTLFFFVCVLCCSLYIVSTAKADKLPCERASERDLRWRSGGRIYRKRPSTSAQRISAEFPYRIISPYGSPCPLPSASHVPVGRSVGRRRKEKKRGPETAVVSPGREKKKKLHTSYDRHKKRIVPCQYVTASFFSVDYNRDATHAAVPVSPFKTFFCTLLITIKRNRGRKREPSLRENETREAFKLFY